MGRERAADAPARDRRPGGTDAPTERSGSNRWPTTTTTSRSDENPKRTPRPDEEELDEDAPDLEVEPDDEDAGGRGLRGRAEDEDADGPSTSRKKKRRRTRRRQPRHPPPASRGDEEEDDDEELHLARRCRGGPRPHPEASHGRRRGGGRRRRGRGGRARRHRSEGEDRPAAAEASRRAAVPNCFRRAGDRRRCPVGDDACPIFLGPTARDGAMTTIRRSHSSRRRALAAGDGGCRVDGADWGRAGRRWVSPPPRRGSSEIVEQPIRRPGRCRREAGVPAPPYEPPGQRIVDAARHAAPSPRSHRGNTGRPTKSPRSSRSTKTRASPPATWWPA